METIKNEKLEINNEFKLDIEEIELDIEVNPYGVTSTGCCKPTITY